MEYGRLGKNEASDIIYKDLNKLMKVTIMMMMVSARNKFTIHILGPRKHQCKDKSKGNFKALRSTSPISHGVGRKTFTI